MSISTVNSTENNSSVSHIGSTIQSEVNGRTIVKIDPVYAKKNDFGAGVGRGKFNGIGHILGPRFFNGIGHVLLTAQLLFAVVVGTIVVGVATLSLSTTGITFGVLLGSTILISLYIKAKYPRF